MAQQALRFKSGSRARRWGTERKCGVSQCGDLLTIVWRVSVVRQDCRRGWKSASDRPRKRLAPLWPRIAQTCPSDHPTDVYVYTRRTINGGRRGRSFGGFPVADSTRRAWMRRDRLVTVSRGTRTNMRKYAFQRKSFFHFKG